MTKNAPSEGYSYAPVGGRPERPVNAWPRVLVRLFILVVPAQLVGSFLGGQLMVSLGLLGDEPALSNLIGVIAGLLAGLAVGLLLTPPAGQQRTWVLVSGLFGAFTWLALTLLARAAVSVNLPASPWYTWVAGTVLVAGIQAALSWGLWFIRTRS